MAIAFGRKRVWSVLAGAAALLLVMPLLTRADEEFVYHSPAGVAFHVTADGLSAITLGERTLASGSWSASNAESWFKDGGEQIVKSEPAGKRTIEIVNDHEARVRQLGGDLFTTFDYTFDGEDVLISARVENGNADSAMNVAGFSGLTFHFQKPPAGLMPVQNIGYFQANGLRLCHPSDFEPIGGTYATDEAIGVGTSPWNTGIVRTLTLWDYTDWSAGKQDALPDRNLRYFVVSPTPARGAATFDFVLRVSTDRSWQHLLGKYREHFQRTFGQVQYKIDARFMGADYLNGDEKTISPQNPFGLRRRIDSPLFVQQYCNGLIASLKQSNGQGILFWGQTGQDPRGAMYRPDFDVMPPKLAEGFATIAARFKSAGLKIGVATRPRDLAVRLDYAMDQTIFINPDDPAHLDMLWRRYANMINQGCTLFYLDSFGDAFGDIKLMRFLRSRLGPHILTFAEHQTDAIMPYTGGYSETTFTNGDDGKPAGYRLWSNEENWKIYQWLCPGSQMAARLFDVHGTIPKDMDANEWFFGHRITPIISSDDFRARLWDIKNQQDKFVTPDGNWR
jgi:hypothetical protein